MAKKTDDFIEIQIYNKDEEDIFIVSVTGEVSVDWQLDFSAGMLKFSVPKIGTKSFFEGNNVKLYVEAFSKEEAFFNGYVFTKSRGKDGVINVTCFDSLIYLKQQQLYQNSHQYSLTELLNEFCESRGLELGEVHDSVVTLPNEIWESDELLDILAYAQSYTLAHNGSIFQLLDKDGKIYLRDVKNLEIKDYVIGWDDIEDYDYETSIAEGVYNRIVIQTDSGTETVEDLESIAKHGLLQYTGRDNTTPNLKQVMADTLQRVSKVTRKLSLKGVKGHVFMRNGNVFRVYFPELGDINLKDIFLCTNVIHKFKEEHHTMDLEIINNDFMDPINLDDVFHYKDKTQTESDGYKVGSAGGVPGDTVQIQVWNYLRKEGFSKGATAGIMGNIEQESLFNLGVEEYSGGGGYGLIQWTDSRRTDLVNYCRSKGVQINTVNAQMDFMMHELNTGYASWVANYKTMEDPKTCADVFHDKFVRSDDKRTNWKGMENRYSSAIRYFNELGSQEVLFEVQVLSGDIEQKIIQAGRKYLGYPYYQLPHRPSQPWQDTGWHDCSSFTRAVMWDVFQTDVGANTWQQLESPNLRNVTGQNLQVGDLLFPHDGHVQLYIGNNRTLNASDYGTFLSEMGMPSKIWQVRRFKDL